MKVLNKRIDVLCLFDATGVPEPIRFRVTADDGEPQVAKLRVIKREFEKLAGNKMYVYTCQSVIENEMKILTIKYELDSCKWFIYKM